VAYSDTIMAFNDAQACAQAAAKADARAVSGLQARLAEAEAEATAAARAAAEAEAESRAASLAAGAGSGAAEWAAVPAVGKPPSSDAVERAGFRPLQRASTYSDTKGLSEWHAGDTQRGDTFGGRGGSAAVAAGRTAAADDGWYLGKHVKQHVEACLAPPDDCWYPGKHIKSMLHSLSPTPERKGAPRYAFSETQDKSDADAAAKAALEAAAAAKAAAASAAAKAADDAVAAHEAAVAAIRAHETASAARAAARECELSAYKRAVDESFDALNALSAELHGDGPSSGLSGGGPSGGDKGGGEASEGGPGVLAAPAEAPAEEPPMPPSDARSEAWSEAGASVAEGGPRGGRAVTGGVAPGEAGKERALNKPGGPLATEGSANRPQPAESTKSPAGGAVGAAPPAVPPEEVKDVAGDVSVVTSED